VGAILLKAGLDYQGTYRSFVGMFPDTGGVEHLKLLERAEKRRYVAEG